jgi:hypothetical protein
MPVARLLDLHPMYTVPNIPDAEMTIVKNQNRGRAPVLACFL